MSIQPGVDRFLAEESFQRSMRFALVTNSAPALRRAFRHARRCFRMATISLSFFLPSTVYKPLAQMDAP